MIQSINDHNRLSLFSYTDLVAIAGATSDAFFAGNMVDKIPTNHIPTMP